MNKRKKRIILFGFLLAAVAAMVIFLPGNVWQIIAFVFLGILSLIALFFILPITLSLRFNNGNFTAKLRVFFVIIKLYPRKIKDDKPKPVKKAPDEITDEEKTAAKKKKKRSIGEMWQFAKRLAASLAKALKVFAKHVRINAVKIYLPVYNEDASELVTQYGRIQGIIGTARAFLHKRLHIKYKKLIVMPDFAGELQNNMLISCKIVFCPGIIFKMAFVFLITFFKKRPYSRKTLEKALKAKRALKEANKIITNNTNHINKGA